MDRRNTCKYRKLANLGTRPPFVLSIASNVLSAGMLFNGQNGTRMIERVVQTAVRKEFAGWQGSCENGCELYIFHRKKIIECPFFIKRGFIKLIVKLRNRSRGIHVAILQPEIQRVPETINLFLGVTNQFPYSCFQPQRPWVQELVRARKLPSTFW